MIEYEDIDFRASKYPPNPLEVTYWVDLSKDSSGNVIRSYNAEERRWVPLNRDYNKDLWQHEQEIVDALGFEWHHPEEDVIELPDFTGTYFKDGDNLTEIIHSGDDVIKKEVDRLDKKIEDETARAKKKEEELDDKINQETVNRTTIDTQHDSKLKDLTTKYNTLNISYQDLTTKYSTLLSNYNSLNSEVSQLKQQIQTATAQINNYQNLLGLNEEL